MTVAIFTPPSCEGNFPSFKIFFKNFINLLLQKYFMEHKIRKRLLKLLIFISFLGVATSAYLLYNHYLPESQNGLCVSANVFSCSVVNTSKYATLFDLPVALYGIIWFVLLGLLSGGALKQQAHIPKLFWWNVSGFGFVIYLLIAEFLLKTLCLLCTGVHALALAAFIISTSLYISQSKKLKEAL